MVGNLLVITYGDKDALRKFSYFFSVFSTLKQIHLAL